ncbi:hypothetical protein KM914_16280 [Virgibacillus pantothenticus]|uniref:hypothetical protein n=1 Tax=Virgibacillus pantothenticus TaxID=1473 RepID=UPI001C23DE2F|nr:hypothetical protein [Virgibacillus pantothenticus]MBU8567957.1 hypothetical protein [Virgibacillus pantothenticus]MBU8601787.1 hypothetical protein [Virgibacillus pantothenticus]MBU8635941.1 hypothetical protein [Virgibacillus pantothenticus]MBU8643625.1 hypothetical protein [Virgibacillus pantothenticus]MBU8647765.1 hypothetical protein [Virgibacillus pantothenticus]
MQIIIKEYDKTDAVQLKNLLDLSFEDEGLLSIVKNSKFKFAYSAFINDKLVGVIFGWESSFHPYCIYFRILSNLFYKMDDVEEKLLSKVESSVTIESPMQTSIWETSINVKNIYERNGFKEIRRTFMPVLKVSDFKEEVLPFNDKNNYMIKTLSEISPNNELMEKLSLVVRRSYEETHKENAVVDMEPDGWKKLILADDTVFDGSYLFLDTSGKKILAYSFLHESDVENLYELGWCGCSNKQFKRLIPQLILQQIKYSINQNVRSIVGEFDTTDSYAMEVLKTFPFAPCPAWITYQKK